MQRMYIALTVLALTSSVSAQEVTHGLAKELGYKYPLPVGSKFNEVTVVGPKGYVKVNLRKGKETALIFISATCPTSASYDEYMHTLYNDYANKDVQFAFIDSNEEDGPGEQRGDAVGAWKKLTTDTTWTFLPPVFLDSLSEVANMIGAVNTPEVFLFDSTGTLRYRGALTEAEDRTKEYTRMAIDAILAGKPVAIPQTPTFGCSVHPADPDGYGEQ